MSQVSNDDAIRLAVQHHQAGRLVEAEKAYRQAMALRPGDSNPIQLLGVVLTQSGRLEEGLGLIRRAIAIAPQVASYYSNLGFALASNGFKQEAIAVFRQAIAIAPQVVSAYSNLAVALGDCGRMDEAAAVFRQAVAVNPESAQAHMGLADALRKSNSLDEAIIEYQRSFALEPPSAERVNILGMTFQGRGRLDEAINCFRKAIVLRGDAVDFHNNLSSALLQKGERIESEGAARQALSLRPDDGPAWFNLGNALQEQKRLNEAIDAYGRCLAVQPQFAEGLHNLGGALREARRLEESLEQYRSAFRLGFDCFEIRCNLALVLKDLGEIDEAIVWFRRAFELKADAKLESNLIYMLHFHPRTDSASLRDALERWNQRHARPLVKSILPHLNNPAPDRQLRVGYVARGLGNHPVGRFLAPLLKHHDRVNFEVYCYSDILTSDHVSHQLREHMHVLRTTKGISDEQVANQVRMDRIDILVDLMMHVGVHRLLVFAHKPAPVQVTYLAYPGTTGLDAMDYRVTDRYLDPEPTSDDGLYSEESVRLPHCFWCYPEPREAPPIGPLPANTSGAITFGCLNSTIKINSEVIAIWSDLLAMIPESTVMLHCLEGSQRKRIAHGFAARGIGTARLRFIGEQSLEAYFAQYNQIDIALDPFPYPGGTTTCDALWMGVPVVTLAGKTALSRGGVSILSNVGLKELIASSVGEYMEIAAALARDLRGLQSYRSSLRDRMRGSPLMNAPQFAQDMESAYRSMWQKWCVKQAATST